MSLLFLFNRQRERIGGGGGRKEGGGERRRILRGMQIYTGRGNMPTPNPSFTLREGEGKMAKRRGEKGKKG